MIIDVVHQFCEKHFEKIKTYVKSIAKDTPIPFDCRIQENGSLGFLLRTFYSNNFFEII